MEDDREEKGRVLTTEIRLWRLWYQQAAARAIWLQECAFERKTRARSKRRHRTSGVESGWGLGELGRGGIGAWLGVAPIRKGRRNLKARASCEV